MLTWEPRGAPTSYAAVLVRPDDPAAQFGVFFAERAGLLPGCGHGSIGVVRALIDAELIPTDGNAAAACLQTPTGLVHAEATRSDGDWWVTLRNVASFLHRRDLAIEVPGIGPLTVDVAYGGNFYAILPAAAVDLELDPANAATIARTGLAIMHAVDATELPIHPLDVANRGCKHTLFTAPGDGDVDSVGTVVIYTGAVDRSPCGTGTSARMAQLHARNELKIDEDFVHASIIGSRFRGRLVETTQVGGVPAVMPTISGRAWITGRGDVVVEPSDPYPGGFVVNDR
jgi:proline racemase